MKKTKHKRSHSYGAAATFDRLFRPSTALDKSKSTNTSFEKDFDKERGENALKLSLSTTSTLLSPIQPNIVSTLSAINTHSQPSTQIVLVVL